MKGLIDILFRGWSSLSEASLGKTTLSKEVREYRDEIFNDSKTDKEKMRGDVRNVCFDVHTSYNKIVASHG